MPIAQSSVDVSTRSRRDRGPLTVSGSRGLSGRPETLLEINFHISLLTSQPRSTHLTKPTSARLLPTPCCAFLHCRAPPPLNSWPDLLSPRKRRGVLEKISPAFGRYMSTRQQPSFFSSLLFPPLFFPISPQLPPAKPQTQGNSPHRLRANIARPHCPSPRYLFPCVLTFPKI